MAGGVGDRWLLYLVDGNSFHNLQLPFNSQQVSFLMLQMLGDAHFWWTHQLCKEMPLLPCFPLISILNCMRPTHLAHGQEVRGLVRPPLWATPALMQPTLCMSLEDQLSHLHMTRRT